MAPIVYLLLATLGTKSGTFGLLSRGASDTRVPLGQYYDQRNGVPMVQQSIGVQLWPLSWQQNQEEHRFGGPFYPGVDHHTVHPRTPQQYPNGDRGFTSGTQQFPSDGRPGAGGQLRSFTGMLYLPVGQQHPGTSQQVQPARSNLRPEHSGEGSIDPRAIQGGSGRNSRQDQDSFQRSNLLRTADRTGQRPQPASTARQLNDGSASLSTTRQGTAGNFQQAFDNSQQTSGVPQQSFQQTSGVPQQGFQQTSGVPQQGSQQTPGVPQQGFQQTSMGSQQTSAGGSQQGFQQVFGNSQPTLTGTSQQGFQQILDSTMQNGDSQQGFQQLLDASQQSFQQSSNQGTQTDFQQSSTEGTRDLDATLQEVFGMPLVTTEGGFQPMTTDTQRDFQQFQTGYQPSGENPFPGFGIPQAGGGTTAPSQQGTTSAEPFLEFTLTPMTPGIANLTEKEVSIAGHFRFIKKGEKTTLHFSSERGPGFGEPTQSGKVYSDLIAGVLRMLQSFVNNGTSDAGPRPFSESGNARGPTATAAPQVTTWRPTTTTTDSTTTRFTLADIVWGTRK